MSYNEKMLGEAWHKIDTMAIQSKTTIMKQNIEDANELWELRKFYSQMKTMSEDISDYAIKNGIIHPLGMMDFDYQRESVVYGFGDHYFEKDITPEVVNGFGNLPQLGCGDGFKAEILDTGQKSFLSLNQALDIASVYYQKMGQPEMTQKCEEAKVLYSKLSKNKDLHLNEDIVPVNEREFCSKEASFVERIQDALNKTGAQEVTIRQDPKDAEHISIYINDNPSLIRHNGILVNEKITVSLNHGDLTVEHSGFEKKKDRFGDFYVKPYDDKLSFVELSQKSPVMARLSLTMLHEYSQMQIEKNLQKQVVKNNTLTNNTPPDRDSTSGKTSILNSSLTTNMKNAIAAIARQKEMKQVVTPLASSRADSMGL